VLRQSCWRGGKRIGALDDFLESKLQAMHTGCLLEKITSRYNFRSRMWPGCRVLREGSGNGKARCARGQRWSGGPDDGVFDYRRAGFAGRAWREGDCV